ncbi:cathepsin B-like proteinase, partial [Aphelenchoides avenae]
MSSVPLTALMALSLLPAFVICGASGPIHISSSFPSTYDPAAWNEMADAFGELDVTDRTSFINAKQHFWKASEELREELDDVKLMNAPAAAYDPNSYPSRNASEFDDSIPTPRHFDARDAWPQCRHLIDSVHNQRECGSCWAHAATGVMSDRLCIASNGTIQAPISVHQLVSCCHDCMPG